MKILSVKPLVFDDIKVIRFARFCDARGFFTESFRKSDFFNHPELDFIKGDEFVQVNESLSKQHVVRGLHFQWNPYMGKMVRTIRGRMVDLFLDIRIGSPTFGRIGAYDMPSGLESEYSEWIWVPPGFAHGNYFTEESQIEYFCTGEYSQGCEACISPLAWDIDWSLCDLTLKNEFFDLVNRPEVLITDKDRNGYSLSQWTTDSRSANFIFGK